MKLQPILIGVALILAVLGLILPRYSALPSLGGTTRDDIVLDVDSGRLTSGYALTVSADESSFAGLVNSSGTRTTSLRIGTGTSFTGIGCNNVQYDPPSLTGTPTLNATTSVDVALTGVLVSPSSTQVYWGSMATSTRDVAIVRVSNTSTADFVNVLLVKTASTSQTIDLYPVTLNVCYLGY